MLGHPKAKEIEKYKFERIALRWTCKGRDSNNDCAIFLMWHMKDFQGEIYECPELEKVNLHLILYIYV